MLYAARPPEELADQTGFLMVWFSTRSRRVFSEALETQFGLHPREYGTMTIIDRNPGMTQGAIGQMSGRDPSTMVASVDRLEALGYATRRLHPEDRRKRSLHLTRSGSAVLRRARAMADVLSADVFGALDEPERDELNRLLRKACGLPPASDQSPAGQGSRGDGHAEAER